MGALARQVDAALAADAANIGGMTAQQVRDRWVAASNKTIVSRKVFLDRLVTKLDDLGVLGTIQSEAAAAAADKASATAAQLACLDAVLLIQTMRNYGRETANWDKGRHLARLDALRDTGVITAAQHTILYGEGEPEEEPLYHKLGCRSVPLVRQIQAGLDRQGS